MAQDKGDPRKGKDLYLNTKLLACSSCHKMEGVGGQVGPDLSRVWDTHTIDKLLESIVEPSKEIKEGYQTFRVLTTNGQVVSGLKVTESNDEVVIRDANGRDVRVSKDDIDEIGPTKLSLMPEDAVARLSYDQFIDLLAFLKSRREQESLRGMVLEYRTAGGFTADVESSRPELKADPEARGGPKWLPLLAEGSTAERGPLRPGVRPLAEEAEGDRRGADGGPGAGVGRRHVGVRPFDGPHRGCDDRGDVRGRAEGGLERGAGEGGERRQVAPAGAAVRRRRPADGGASGRDDPHGHRQRRAVSGISEQ